MMTENSTQYLGVSLLRGEASELCGDGECCFEPYRGSRRCSSRWIQSPTRSKVHSNARAPEVHMQEKGRVGAPYNRKYELNLAPPRPVRARCIQRPRALWCGGNGARKALFQESIPLTKTKADIAKFNRTLPS